MTGGGVRDDGGDEDDDESAKPIIPLRAATPQQAMTAIVLIFFIGIAIGFALGRTL